MKDFFNISTLTGLIPVIVFPLTVLQGIQAIKHKTWKSLGLLALLILFIQWVCKLSYDTYKSTTKLMGITLAVAIIVYLISQKRNSQWTYSISENSKIKFIFVFALLSCILALILFNHANEAANLTDTFIKNLDTYKVSPDLYVYLFQNIQACILLILRFFHMLYMLLIWCTLLHSISGNELSYFHENKLFIYSMFFLFVSSGCINALAQAVQNLF